MATVRSDLTYSLGLVAQILFDAAPEDLTLQGLHDRTELAESMLARVLRICGERRHIRCEGERYFAAHESA